MKRLLIYVEDPGAANFIIDLPQKLSHFKIETVLIADGHARSFLNLRKIVFTDYSLIKSLNSYYKKIKPLLTIVGTSENKYTPAYSFINESRKNKIPSIGFVDMLANYEYRFKGNSNKPLKNSPDYLIVPDRDTFDAFLNLGFQEKKIFICPHPTIERTLSSYKLISKKYTKVELRKECYKLKEKLEQPVWVFISEGYDKLDKEFSFHDSEYSFHGWGEEKFRTFIILEEIIELIKELKIKPFLVVRLHPKNKKSDFKKYFKYVDFFSQEEDPLKIIMTSNLVLGMTSMLLYESSIIGLNTLALLPKKDQVKLLPNTSSGLTQCIFTRQELNDFFHKSEENFIETTSKSYNKNTSVEEVIQYILEKV